MFARLSNHVWPTLFIPCAVCALSLPAAAQDSTRVAGSDACPNARYVTATRVDSSAPATPDSRRPDIVILASVTADEVRFSAQPRIRVRVCGDLDSARIVARRNLPDPVIVGETYRNVYIAVELLGHLAVTDSTRSLQLPPP
jgi:hypothetical protein